MRLPDLVPPVPPPNGNNRKFREYNRAANCGGDFFAALDAEADVAVAVADDDEGLEAGALAGARLFLDGHNFHDLVLELGAEEGFDDLVFFDGERVEVDLFEAADFAFFH
eukprot:TRINITY_DN398_c0_g2_i1.p3 TRINITY_DN398_c0_g2~~TRINITY_DN398_c0_g2_i1.p3  ORF type:complete len:110 (+),score=14.56 TRINITY_DN398_c0_g2_i1:573-902(+)